MAAAARKNIEEIRAYLQRKTPFLAPRETRATGIEAVDQLLGGGFPKGSLTVLTGQSGMGRSTLATMLIAQETRLGRAVAWIDGQGTLYPPALAFYGVELERLLIVQNLSMKALRAAEQILQSDVFSTVVISGLDRWLSSQRTRRLQSMSEGTQVSTLLIVEPKTAQQLTHVPLRLRLTQQPHGVVVRVEKDSARPQERRASFVPPPSFVGSTDALDFGSITLDEQAKKDLSIVNDGARRCPSPK